MAKQHNPGFLRIVEDAKTNVREVSPAGLRERQTQNPNLVLVDVREDDEWRAGHVAGAVHIGKGVIERDIESQIPEPDTEVVLYCGGGFRSALAAESLQRMGYTNVLSLDGGYRALQDAGFPIETA